MIGDFDTPPTCCLCVKKAGLETDMGPLCSGCFFVTNKLSVWLYEKLEWRPMTKDERRAHEQHCG